MHNISTRDNVAPSVLVDHGHLYVSSENVADVFEKRHDNVLRDIENIISENDESRALNFEVSDEIKDLGFLKKKFKVYRLSRDGLMFLVMGYTGKKANALKWAYIDEFNRMEKELRGEGRKTIDVEQQFAIREAVNDQVRRTGKTHQTVYRDFYKAFKIPRYTELLSDDFPKAMEFLGHVEKRGNRKALLATDETVMVKREVIEAFSWIVYETLFWQEDYAWRFLDSCRFARLPLSQKFFDFFMRGNIKKLNRDLKASGIDVEEVCRLQWEREKEALRHHKN